MKTPLKPKSFSLPVLLALFMFCACARTRTPGVTLVWSDRSPGTVWAYSLDIELPDGCRGAELIVSSGEDEQIAVFQPETLRGEHMFYILADEGAVRLCFPGGNHRLSLGGRALTDACCLVSKDCAAVFDENGCTTLFAPSTGCKAITVSLRVI